ncbi:dTDP-4-dehydrorhamnose 3,5-epimerase [Salinimicrobium sediminis]|uniref:dTDP-4-dehydrorhamnose 3,5-epimerase n=1 Tax=Salinimicrobium sediminis TaxID=1343891 RepID=A0A285X4T9_9FLAO|nr:dTDP-4-dehydrorhamnose 3,5-epimerase family protein [Salinimicrobium sediminis]SOC80332.1 dTDP-4-dehydrorhamnose 3,5-epimerase [Salinimicrobium sediminis]
MEVLETNISGCFEIQPKMLKDNRGWFLKTFHLDQFRDQGLETNWEEEYFSCSNKNVLRGIHFQIPPNEHFKLVTCLNGKVLDVIIDLRKSSSTYLKCFSTILTDENNKMVYIPKGCGHAFLSLEDNSVLFYKVSTVYSPKNDKGILWNTINYDWPISNPTLSPRDTQHPSLNNFINPF